MPFSPAEQALLKFLEKRRCLNVERHKALADFMQTRKVSAVEALCDGEFLEESVIVDAFVTGLRVPRAALGDLLPRLARPLDDETLKAHLIVPARLEAGRLLLAMVNPLDQEAIRKVRFATGYAVVPVVAPLSEVRSVLEHQALHQQAKPGDGGFSTDAEEPSSAAEVQAATDSSNPIVKMATLILAKAVNGRASDIHLEPTADGISVRYRIDGVLEEAARLPVSVRGTLTARFKVMASMDIAERRVPQDGRISFTESNRHIDGRVSTLPTQYGEKVVIRILDSERALVDLNRLGFEPWERQRVDECLHRREGMILTTGPTGSGKSTTSYSMIRAIQSPGMNIVTVEDPIEYRLPGITQTEINERQGLTFATALRSVLRQDPDVVLVGEIRDHETAEIAIQAAQTGHLVISTLHTNDAVGALTRLANLGIDRELIASSLLMVIAQRLVRSICPQCKAPVSEEMRQLLPLREAWGDGPVMWGKGCASCHLSGYRGRSAIYEVFRNTSQAQRLIKDGASELDLRNLLAQQGGRLLMQVALEKVRAGVTTADEIARVIRPEEGVTSCPSCHQRVELRFRTCPFCGVPLRSECAACHAPLKAGWDRCPDCGTSVVHELAGEEATEPAESQATRTVTLVAPSDRSSSSLLGAAVRAICVAGGLDESAAVQLETGVVEACSLAVSSTPEGSTAELKLEVEISADGCRVCVSGQGPAWPWQRPSAGLPDLEAFAAGNSPAVRAFLIRGCTDEASYERTDQTNRIWLIKRPTPIESSPSDVETKLSA